jgi:DNA-binding transcriptional ArsR family regulator
VLTALADPMRRRLLDLLTARGETSATALAGELPVTRQAVMQHLSVLEQADLVTSRRIGRERRYSLRPDPLTTTADWMAHLARQWDARLEAIRLLAESPDTDA